MPINKQINITEHVKKVMESTLSLIEETAGATGVFPCGDLSEITRLELFQFVAYLCASDDVIQQDETDFLNLIFEEEWEPDTLVAYLKNNAIRNGEFEKMVPFTLEILVQLDAVLSRQKKEWRGNLSELFVSLYELLGKVFIETVPHSEEWESFDLLDYISFLQSFISKKLSCFGVSSEEHHEEFVADISSQSEDFIIPAKKEDLVSCLVNSSQ